jgi:two-component system chemotaxis sensor kinase CheA
VNEFERQFLIESRELVEQGADGLLTLERSPGDGERLDTVFRAFHTLKGGAAIVAFSAMERAMHAAEELLGEVRSGRRALSPILVGQCLECLELVLKWLDTLEQTGKFPGDADGQANGLVQRLGAAPGGSPDLGRSADSSVARRWVTDLLERSPDVRGRATSAIRFLPDADCFYRGDDPVAQMSSLPDLLAFYLEPVREWPSLDEFDPFTCNLILTALTASPVDEVSGHMKGHSGSCEIRPVSASEAAHSSLSPRVRTVLEAQAELLGDAKLGDFVGRVASAGRVASNALRFCGRDHDADLIVSAMEGSLMNQVVEDLRRAIAQVLSSAPAVIRVGAVESGQRTEVAPRTLRVDAERIDALVRLAGELTIAKNAVGHIAKIAQQDGNSLAGVLKDRHGELEHLIAELQQTVLGVRVIPLRSVLQRLPRAVREMSAALGKPVRLELEGEDTEADKAIVEMLFEPLLHILRNAIDHGVESPTIRAARGKPAGATIRIRASRQADQVLIEVSDDGGGIDVERVRRVAQEQGVATEEILRTMTEAELIDLVFEPGFSTATKVSELSGRGVGLDAARAAVERLGGRVAIDSRAALGTTVRLSLPFSLMLTHVMTVEAGGQILGLPLDAVVETVRVPTGSIAAVGGGRAIVLRNRTIPVIELADLLGGGERINSEVDAIVVIAAAAGQLSGIHVDRVGQRMDVILKPLDGLLAGTPGISGTTVLGDGRVLLVLDIGEILR